MFSKPVPAHLLPDEALDLSARLFVQDNIIKPVRGSAQLHQVREVAARRREWHSHRLPLTGVATHLLNRLPNPFGHASMTLARLGGSYLQRDREELFIVTGGSAAQHRKDLSSIGHGVGTIFHLWIPLTNTIPTSTPSNNARFRARPLRGATPVPSVNGRKTDPRMAPLTGPALAVLDGIERVEGVPWVIADERRSDPPADAVLMPQEKNPDPALDG